MPAARLPGASSAGARAAEAAAHYAAEVLRYLPVLLVLAVVIYCLVECIQTPSDEVRNLPKWAWIIMIVVLDVIGCAAWFFAGRPKRQASPASGPAASPGWLPGGRGGRQLAPDDDPEFLKGLKKHPPSEHDRLLDEWERQLRGDKPGSADGPSPKATPGGPAGAAGSENPAPPPDGDDAPDPTPDPSPEDPPSRS